MILDNFVIIRCKQNVAKKAREKQVKKAPFENMTEKPDPGSARLGNFINYYEFNPADERVRHIDKTLFDNLEDANGLDIGCNSGVCKN